MKKYYSTLFAGILMMLAGKSFGQCTVEIIGDTLTCVGAQTTLTADVTGSGLALQASNTAGNNHRGNMFDIVATNAVKIISFEASPMGNTTIEIYYKVGTWNGFANTPSAWTYIGSAPVAYTGGFTPVDVDVNVTIPAGQTYAFYVTSNTAAVSLNYSNGTNVGNVYTADANISFLEGGGMEYPFTQNTGAVYQPRVWNGKINYALANVPVTTNWNTMATTTAISPVVNGTAVYSVVATASGCPTMHDTVTLYNSIPPVSAGLTQSHCFGDTVIVYGTGAETYAWDNGVTDSVGFVPASAGITSYTVTGTDTLGCTNTASVNITAFNLPAVFAGADFAVCFNDTVTLAATGAESYTWNNGVTDNVPFSLNVPTTYIVNGVDTNGCHNSDTISVSINQLPDVFAGDDFETCANVQSIVSGSGASTYLWSNGVTNGVPFFAIAGTEDYIVTGTDINGCSNTDTVAITAGSFEEAQVFLVGSTLVGSSLTSATLKWINCSTNQVVAGETGNYFVPQIPGNYAVVATMPNGCRDTSACISVGFVSLSENTTSAFSVYPNPTTGLVIIKSNGNVIEKVQIADMIGKIIYEEEKSVLETSVDLSSFDGMQFFVIVHTQGSQETTKVIRN